MITTIVQICFALTPRIARQFGKDHATRAVMAIAKMRFLVIAFVIHIGTTHIVTTLVAGTVTTLVIVATQTLVVVQSADETRVARACIQSRQIVLGNSAVLCRR